MTLSRFRAYIVPAALGAAAILGGLYWIITVYVHGVPESLKPLTALDPPKPAPAVVFMGSEGRMHTLSEFKGRYVLLNLWAPWCAPCVGELPALAALQKSLPPGRFVVVAVDVGREGQGEAKAFLASHGAGGLDAYVDSNTSLLRNFAAWGLPMSTLIGPDGREIARAEGAVDWSAPDSIAYFKRRTSDAAP